MRIRLELEQRGFSAELIQRKTSFEKKIDFESIIKSIETCDCMVICASSSFEFEKICQFETMYALKLQKVIIPVVVQAKYLPDYWLEPFVEFRRVINVNLASIKNDMNLLSKEICLNAKIKPKSIQRENNFTTLEDSNRSRTCQIL